MLDFIAWYLIITLVGVLALPAACRLLPNLADRGYVLARALGMLLWGFIFWLLTSLNILQNDLGGVILALILMAAASFWLGRGWRGTRSGWSRCCRSWMRRTRRRRGGRYGPRLGRPR